MSSGNAGIRRTATFNAIKTRGLVLQNPDGTFPPANAVLQLDDSTGTVIPSRNLDVDSLVVNNNNLIIDNLGQITARSITLTSSATAITTTSGDVVVNDANVVVTGDQINTGYVSCAALQLTNPDVETTQNNTYLWVNDQDLLWQSEALNTTLNISQGIQNLVIDPSGVDLIRPTDSSDSTGMYNALVTILNIFNKRSLFIGISGETPTPSPPPPPPGVLPLRIYFNSPCNFMITVTDLCGEPITSPFRYSATQGANSASYSISSFMTNLSRIRNSEGVLLSQYITFVFDTVAANEYRARIQFTSSSPTYQVYFSDVDRVCEAKRFLTQLQLLYIVPGPSPTPNFTCYTDISDLQLTATTDLRSYCVPLNNSLFGQSITGADIYFNKDTAVAAPVFTVANTDSPSQYDITITSRPSTTGLSGENVLEYFGVTYNTRPIYIIAAPPATPTGQYPFTFRIETQTYPSITPKRITIVSVDKYNQSTTPRTVTQGTSSWPNPP